MRKPMSEARKKSDQDGRSKVKEYQLNIIISTASFFGP